MSKVFLFDLKTHIFAQNLEAVMSCKRLFSLLILVFGLSGIANSSFAQTEGNGAAKEEKKGINITELVFGHVSDMHRWHLFSIKHENAPATHISMPLPMIVY